MSKNTAYEIQKKAIELFREKGYSNVTIEEICNAAEITKSTFYYHYASKDRLLANFYENTSTLSPETLHLLATSDNCWHKLWACMEPSIDWTISAGSSILSQIFISNIQNQEDTFSTSYEPEHVKLFKGIVEKGQESGQFMNQSSSQLIYNNIKNIVLGIAVQWCIAGGSFDEKQVIKESIASMLSVREDMLINN